MNHVRKLASVGYDRKWTTLHSDGVPHVYASYLQVDLFVCDICSEEARKDDKADHSKGHSSAATYAPVFGDIILRPGPGYIEMNMAKNCLKCAGNLSCQRWQKASVSGHQEPKMCSRMGSTIIDHDRYWRPHCRH